MKKENPIPRKIRRNQCLKEMTDTIEKIGPWSCNKLSLAKKYDFDWETISRWFTYLMRNITPETMKNMQVMAEHALVKNLEQCEQIRIDPRSTKGERLKAMSLLNDTIEKLTKFLEDWGRKEKIADKLQMEVQDSNREVLKNIFSQLKGGKDGSDKSSVSNVVQVQPDTKTGTDNKDDKPS